MTQQARSQCGAPSASSLWSSIDWQQVEDDVFRFQMRIANGVLCWGITWLEPYLSRAIGLSWLRHNLSGRLSKVTRTILLMLKLSARQLPDLLCVL